MIVLKDLPDWEMRAIIHFMYKGEINVGQEQLPLLLQAAETLQVRKHYNIISAIREEDLNIVFTYTYKDKFSDVNVNLS